MDKLERYEPEIGGQIAYEHLHRYAIAKNYVADARVLDIACGEGYGTALLSEAAAHVTGVDINAEAIERAEARYTKSDRLVFLCGDGEALPLKSGSVDVVVSFETIEHVPDAEKLMTEIKRVLTKGGLLVLSMPNRPIYNQLRSEPNAFHIGEMDIEEGTTLLRRHFAEVETIGQRMAIVSLTNPMSGGVNAIEYQGYTGSPASRRHAAEAFAGVVAMPNPEYLLFFCSDRAITHPLPLNSLFLNVEDDLWMEHAGILKWASGLHEEDEVLRHDLREAQAGAKDLEARVELERSAKELALVKAQLAESTQDMTQEQRGQILRDELRIAAPLIARLRGEPTPEADIGLLVDTLSQTIADHAVLSLRLKLAEAKSNELTGQAGALVTAKDAATSELATIISRLENSSTQLADRQSQLNSVTRERDSLQGSHAELSREQDLTKGRLEEAARHHAALEDERGHARQALDHANQRLAKATEETVSLREEMAQSKMDAAIAKQADAELRLRLELAEVDREAALGAVSDANNEAGSLREQVGQSEKDAAIAKQAEAELRSRLDLAKRDREAALGAVSKAEARTARMNRRLSSLRRVARHGTQSRALLSDRDASERRLLALRNEATRAQEKLEAVVRSMALHEELVATFMEATRVIAPLVAHRERPKGFSFINPSDVTDSDKEKFVTEGWFDEEWYRERATDAFGEMSPVDHFWAFGNAEGLRPHPLYDEVWLEVNSADPAVHPLLAFLRNPERGSIGLTSLFDPLFYRSRLLPEDQADDPLAHYLRNGWSHDRPTHPIFQIDWMQENWPTEKLANFSLENYLVDQSYFRLSPHHLFDPIYYLDRNPDVGATAENPLSHYLSVGWREGRQPTALFHGHWYLARHCDVLQGNICPLTHFVGQGAVEQRQPHPLFDPGFYLDRNADVAAAGKEPFAHFVVAGCNEGRAGSPQVSDLLASQAGADPSERSGLLAMIMNGLDRGLVSSTLSVSEADLTKQWPPKPLGDYHLPQDLRNYVIERHGESVVHLNAYLFSVIERYESEASAFDNSEACQRIVARIQQLSPVGSPGRPSASIIIPAYNNLVYTLTCILSVIELNDGTRYEIIVADDCSTDSTSSVIPALGGVIRLARQEQNLGFLRNCNEAVKIARGDYIILLNNDTIVLPGWLDALLAPFTADESIGFAGSKLLNGDGTLQEAGGIFWSDGSAWNFGRNQDPRMPEFNYLKDVDYCSGASIALPRRLWRELGGFDPIYDPAYCEDSDIAFRVRALGKRTVYAPHSELVHHEGRSHGRDVESGIKAYQVTNQQKLFERWQGTLEENHFSNGDQVPLARDRSRYKPHILVVDHYVPQWDRDAGSRTIYLYMRMLLASGFHVTLWPDNLNEDRDYTTPLQAMGIEVIYSQHFVGKFSDWLDQNGRYYKYALLSRPHIAEKYIDAMEEFPNIKTIFYGHDLHYRRLEQQMEINGKSKELRKEVAYWKSLERDVCRRCDVILYPGHEEVEIVKGWVEPTTSVLPFPITIFSDEDIEHGRERAAASDRDPHSLMFVGGFTHTPNTDAIIWFVREVMPILSARNERFRLSIAGSNAPPSVIDLGGGPVEYLGRISDEELSYLYEQSALAVVPLLYGGGVKGKVIEAMANGTPVAMTSIGAQGISGAEGMAFIGDRPTDLAQQILFATSNPDEARDRALAALDFIDAHYSSRAAKALLGQEIPELFAE